MIIFFRTKNQKRLRFTSKYNVNLYKKCLSLKLVSASGNPEKFAQNCKLPNLKFNLDGSVKLRVRVLKCIYTRKERVPIRILRLLTILNKHLELAILGCNFLIAKRLSVYNGKELKFINITTVY